MYTTYQENIDTSPVFGVKSVYPKFYAESYTILIDSRWKIQNMYISTIKTLILETPIFDVKSIYPIVLC